MNFIYQGKYYWFLIACILILLSGAYVAVASNTVGMATVQWDEFTDLVIASQLSQHPLGGHSWDGSQARFPMYATAVAHRIMQTVNPNLDLLKTLPVSRWLSVFMTVLAIWGTFILGDRLFNAATGVLAAILFTISPYVLHFGQTALTQGDAFTPAAVVFTLIAFEQFTNKRTTIWLVGFSFCLALTIAAKFFLAALIPALMTYHLLLELSKRYRKPDPLADPIQLEKTREDWPYTSLALSTGIFALLAMIFAFQRFDQPPGAYQQFTLTARLIWGVALLGVFFCLSFAIKSYRERQSSSLPKAYWRLGTAWLVALPLTVAITLALFPAHIFNPFVLSSLSERFVTMDGNSALLATSLDSIKLYLGLLLFKLGLPFGFTIFVALAWVIRKSLLKRSFLLITVVLLYYGLLLVILPLQQPFWLMSVYPLIVIALSAIIIFGLTNIKNAKLRWAWLGYIAGAFAWLFFGLVQVYPTFGFYGYELVGERWLGNLSLGHRALVVVTNDGSVEAIDWLRQHVDAGSSVISYLDDPHIINYFESIQPFEFDFQHALQYQEEDDLNKDLVKADFVVVRTIADNRFFAPVADAAFIQRFGTEPVYEIFRGRGVYRMPIIQIYQRVSDNELLP